MRKAQYYILAAAFVIFMVASIYFVSRTTFNIKNTASDYIFSNIKNDFPNAVNTIVENNSDSASIEANMSTYINFLQNYTQRRNLILRGYFVVGVPHGNDLNITIGNFYNSSLYNFEVNATNNTATLSNKQIILEKNQVYTFPTYSNIYKKDNTINITIKHDAMAAEEFETTKKLFSYIRLEMVQEQNVWANTLINK